MESALKEIAGLLEKSPTDYLIAIIPIVLSIIAVIISIWNSFGAKKVKQLQATMVWDDLQQSFYILVRNIGNALLVINEIKLVGCDRKRKKELVLGLRNNIWADSQKAGSIRKNEVLIIKPSYGSTYDVFAYRGHSFNVDSTNQNFSVKMYITDIDGKQWEFKTPFVLGEIDEKLSYANPNC